MRVGSKKWGCVNLGFDLQHDSVWAGAEIPGTFGEQGYYGRRQREWDANKVHTLSVVESTIRKSFVSNECIA